MYRRLQNQFELILNEDSTIKKLDNYCDMPKFRFNLTSLCDLNKFSLNAPVGESKLFLYLNIIMNFNILDVAGIIIDISEIIVVDQKVKLYIEIIDNSSYSITCTLWDDNVSI